MDDAEDQAAIARAQAREAQLGKEVARRDYLPIKLAERRLAGEHPVRLWCEHRGITADELARAALLCPEMLSNIEAELVALSLELATLIGGILDVPLDELGARRLAAAPTG
jgi:hypothetical protein